MLIDLISLAIILVSAINGLRLGFIIGFASFFGLIIAFILSDMFLNDVYREFISFFKVDSFPKGVSENYYIYIAAYILTMLLIYSLIYLLSKGLKVIFKGLMLGWLDSFLGAVFGLVKGVVLASLFLSITVFLSKFSSSLQGSIKESKAMEFLPNFNNVVYEILPDDMRTFLVSYKGK